MTEEDQIEFKREFGQLKSGNPDHKSDKQSHTKKMLKIFMTQDKKLSIKSIQQLNEIIIKNGYYIYEFRKQQYI